MVQIDQLHFPYGKQIFRTEMRENTYVEPEAIFWGKIKQMDTWLGNEHNTSNCWGVSRGGHHPHHHHYFTMQFLELK